MLISLIIFAVGFFFLGYVIGRIQEYYLTLKN